MSNSDSDSETASLLSFYNTKPALKKMSNSNSEDVNLDHSGHKTKDDQLVVEEPTINQVISIICSFELDFVNAYTKKKILQTCMNLYYQIPISRIIMNIWHTCPKLGLFLSPRTLSGT